MHTAQHCIGDDDDDDEYYPQGVTRKHRKPSVADLPVLDVAVVISGDEGVPGVAPSHRANGTGVGLSTGAPTQRWRMVRGE